MRGDKTITEGSDSVAEREKRFQAIIEKATQAGQKETIGFCGLCSSRYIGPHTKHKCK